MNKSISLFAKFAGLHRNFTHLERGGVGRGTVSGNQVSHLLQQYEKLRDELVQLEPDLFSDLPIAKSPIPYSGSNNYGYVEVLPIIQSIEYILEVRSNLRHSEDVEEKKENRRIFISHGSSKEWHKVQNYLEKDLGYETLELAQEANLGRTVLQKLNEESDKCFCAVIVMTGDDQIIDGPKRARENVMHEIGFFQGKYGLKNVCLLHEEETSIPSNIGGLVYSPFQKDYVESTFGLLLRELKAIYS